MHRAASRFARMAVEAGVAKEPARAIGALAEVTQQCVACHASFKLK
jgi:cytochrome c556